MHLIGRVKAFVTITHGLCPFESMLTIRHLIIPSERFFGNPSFDCKEKNEKRLTNICFMYGNLLRKRKGMMTKGLSSDDLLSNCSQSVIGWYLCLRKWN